MIPETRDESKWLSAKTWARRWDCSVASVRRAARRFNIRRAYVGAGRNGLVRYALEDIVRLEQQDEKPAASDGRAGG